MGLQCTVGLSYIGGYEGEEGQEGHDTKVELIWGSSEPVSSGAVAGKPYLPQVSLPYFAS